MQIDQESALLTLLLLLPIIGAIAVLCVKHRAASRWVALGVSLAALALALLLLIPFDWHRGSIYGYAGGGGAMQLVQDVTWVAQFNVHYKVGIDGLSLPLIFLVTFITPVALIASWRIERMQRGYLALLLFLQFTILGAFLAVDLFQFYVFFELCLLPMYFLIGIWGGPWREYAALKFFLYALVGSLSLLVGVIGIYLYSRQIVPRGTFDLIQLASPAFQAKLSVAMGGLAGTTAKTLFVLLMIGFLVRLPSVPFHTWLPEAHVEACSPISMVLAALVLNVGGYGILRVAYPLFPQAAKTLWLLFAVLGLVSLIYGGLCALAQTDFKRLVAYSSVSQLGFVTLGAAMMTPAGISGALFMMIAHGVSSAMLFFIAGVVHDRMHHRDMNQLGGLAGVMPKFTGFSVVGFFADLGLPGLCGFVGGVLVLLGAFQAARPDSVLYQHAVAIGGLGSYLIAVRVIAITACVSPVITAGYMLWAFQRIYLGLESPREQTLRDVDGEEMTALICLTTMAILLGILPAFFVFALSNSTVAGILKLF